MRVPKFAVFQDEAGEWRWHLKAANGRIISQGEGHTRPRGAERALRTVIKTAVRATVPARKAAN